MKLTKEKMNKLIEMVTNDLRKKLEREPTEKEVVDKLPVFLCNNKEME